jgi:orotidine-5'-phosphate decarboxylase
MKLCIALDLETLEENIALAKELRDFDIWLKVGFRSYIRDGQKIINELKAINQNFKIFLDLKLYDIPNTMADASEVIANMGVDMFNVHASAGSVAMSTVMNRIKNIPNRPIVLAVTALTSFSNEDFQKVYSKDINQKAKDFAIDSFQSDIDGVVCSAYESKLIKSYTNENFLTLTPGIRPFNEDKGDQQRVATIETAKEQLVDFMVVGRPIYKANNPKKVVEKILNAINQYTI